MPLIIQMQAAVRTAKQSTSSLIYGGDLVYHGKEALEVDLQNSPPPSISPASVLLRFK